MTERVQVGSLQVAKVLYDFVVEEALPGTGVDAETFWAGADKVITELAPKNRDLLAKRDDLQAQIDQWHRDHAGAPIDAAAYKAFLQEIGYLLPTPAEFSVTTANVDTEITSTAGPQLVVPILNARLRTQRVQRPLGFVVRRAVRHQRHLRGERRREGFRLQQGPRRTRSSPGRVNSSMRQHLSRRDRMQIQPSTLSTAVN